SWSTSGALGAQRRARRKGDEALRARSVRAAAPRSLSGASCPRPATPPRRVRSRVRRELSSATSSPPRAGGGRMAAAMKTSNDAADLGRRWRAIAPWPLSLIARLPLLASVGLILLVVSPALGAP